MYLYIYIVVPSTRLTGASRCCVTVTEKSLAPKPKTESARRQGEPCPRGQK